MAERRPSSASRDFHSTKRPADNRHRRQRRAATAAGKGGWASRGGERRSKLAPTVPQAKSRNHTALTGGTAKGGRDDRRGMGAHAAATVHQHGAHRLRRRNPRHRTNAARNCSGRRKHKEHEHEGRTRSSRSQGATSPECVRTAQPRALPYGPSCYNETSSSVTLCQEHRDWYTQPNQPKQSFSAYTKASRRLGQYRPSTQQPKSTA